MDKKKLWKLLFEHSLFFIVGTVFFVCLFHTPLFRTSVFFYRGIALLCIATIGTLTLLLYFRKTKHGSIFTIHDVILCLVLIFCINIVFFTHVPVTADRSLSVFLLEVMDSHSEKSFTKEEMTDIFIQTYMNDHQNIQKRFDEQVISGNIQKVNSGYVITKQGKSVVVMYGFVADLFKVDKKNISP